MKIVIDVGCAYHPNEDSVAILIERFHPDILFGFDPLVFNNDFEQDGTEVRLRRLAAWTKDGHVGFLQEGSRSRVASEEAHKVVGFDLAKFVADLEAAEVVLKIDAEGAEYDLLPHLHNQGVDSLLKLAWVEWHKDRDPGGIERLVRKHFSAPLEDWTF